MKHHGQTTSETTSIRTGWLGRAWLAPVGANLITRSLARQPPWQPITRIIRLSSVSPAFSVASVTLAASLAWARCGASMTFLSTPAMRRATTWALRRSVWVKATRMAPSLRASGKIDVADEPRQQPRAVELARSSSGGIERKSGERQRLAAVARLGDCLAQVAAQKASRVSKPVCGSNMPSASSDLSMRLSRARRRACAPAAPCARPGAPDRRRRDRYWAGFGEIGRRAPRWPITATGMSRKRVSCASTVRKASTMRGENPSPTTMPSMSRELSCLAAVSTLSAPSMLTRSPMATLNAG